MADNKRLGLVDLPRCYIDVDRYEAVTRGMQNESSQLLADLVRRLVYLQDGIQQLDSMNSPSKVIMLGQIEMVLNSLHKKGILAIYDENAEPTNNYNELFGNNNVNTAEDLFDEEEEGYEEEDEGPYDDF